MSIYGKDRDSLRQVFFTTWKKYQQSLPLQGVETLLLDTILLHPEYHVVLDDPDTYLQRDYLPEQGETNPFLHMSLHVTIEEQLSIDNPGGIRECYNNLLAQTGDRHDTLHQLLDCLGEAVWQTQRDPDTDLNCVYLDCLKLQDENR